MTKFPWIICIALFTKLIKHIKTKQHVSSRVRRVTTPDFHWVPTNFLLVAKWMPTQLLMNYSHKRPKINYNFALNMEVLVTYFV